MINLETRYAGRIDPATTGFPGGRVKNETTPGTSNDGTPLDKDWANNIEGFMQALLDAAGLTDDNSIEQVGASQCLTAIQTLINTAGYLNNSEMVGQVGFFARMTAPAGWVEANGGTIGNAGSGATLRANADTATLYALLWDFDETFLPIQDNTGAASTRGASAASDFAAGKRLTVQDLRGEFLRGWDNGRGVDSLRFIGSPQADEIKSHKHNLAIDSDVNSVVAANNSAAVASSAGGLNSNGTNQISNTGGTETRPRNVAFLVCIKY